MGPDCWLEPWVRVGYGRYSFILLSVRRVSDLLVWCLSVCLILLLFLLTVLCFSFSLLLNFALFLSAFWYCLPLPPHHPHSPTQLPFFCPFLCLDFPILVSVQSVPYFSVVAASKLTECFCLAVCWFYSCHTKLNLMWLLGCYLQFISFSAALVKRTLSRYFFS